MQWIKIENGIPEIGQRVLVYQKDGVFGGDEIDIACRTYEYDEDYPEHNNRIVWDGQGIVNDIHYWMPLPNPPKE